MSERFLDPELVRMQNKLAVKYSRPDLLLRRGITPGTNLPGVKPGGNTITPTPGTATTGTFNSASLLGEVWEALDILTNTLTKLSVTMQSFFVIDQVDTDPGPTAPES